MTHLILLLLKEFLPSDLALIITSMYNLFVEKIKPGQTVFDSPCGHTLRSIMDIIPTKFVCPINKVTYNFDKIIYARLYWKRTNMYDCHLVEITKNDILLSKIRYESCKICDRYWKFTENKTGLKKQTRCFCDKNVDDFPCDRCRPDMCYQTGCCWFVYGKKSKTLCRNHYQCSKCKIPYVYDHNISDYGADQWIEYSCLGCKTNKSGHFYAGLIE
uniref:Uncharacterized protein n=1 Tax=viral metagenome TaxID=1070528 RepID=A0A6C0C8D4_9ZZZZ